MLLEVVHLKERWHSWHIFQSHCVLRMRHGVGMRYCYLSMAQDFTSAVMDVDYSPTGREFVAGSYDRSLRIFGHTGGHSREVSAAMPMFCKCVFCLVCVEAWHKQCSVGVDSTSQSSQEVAWSTTCIIAGS